jgi:hypothetical protein
MLNEWKLTSMESLCTCGGSLHVNTCSIWELSTSKTRCKRNTSFQLCHATCHLWSLQQQFNFRLQLLNSVRVGSVYTISGVAPEQIMAGIHVRWTWWPGTPTHEALWKSIRQDTTTKNIMQDVQDDIQWCWRAPSCWKKSCVHMPCELIFAVAPGTDGSLWCPPRSPWLLIVHPTVQFARWSDVCAFSEVQNLVFYLFTNPSRRKSARLRCLLVALSICTTWILYVYRMKSRRMMACVDVPFDTELWGT